MFTKDSQQRRGDDRAGPIESAIARETMVQGDLQSAFGIRIGGSIEGKIEAASHPKKNVIRPRSGVKGRGPFRQSR